MGRVRTLEEREFARARKPFFRHPAQTLVTAFAAAVVVGTLLLLLPWARRGDAPTGFLDALFTSTSAVCVTGLSTVDVPHYWSPFGQVVILALIQVGGFGIMTLASLLGLLVSRRMGLRTRVTAAAESNSIGIGDVRRVVTGVLKVTVVIELSVAVLLALRFATAYDESPGRAAYLGIFHAVSAFNNAGFALWSDSLVGFIGDPWINLPLCAAVILGGIGFPVLFELRRELRRPRLWSLHTRITVWGSLVLLLAGWVFVTAAEWTNPATLGGESAPTRVLAGFTQSVMPRTAGFQSVDYAQMDEPSVFVTTILMFIGGGSASTAGGIKVGTFFLLLYVILAEVRGERDVEAGDRRIDLRAQRQALTVALLSVAVVVSSALLMMGLAGLTLNQAMFEVTSAFATVGLSSVGTGTLPDSAQVLLIALMFIGRLGPVTLVSALALRERQHVYRLPEGRPLIG
jgi:trk system potassium uptake protein TrkH